MSKKRDAAITAEKKCFTRKVQLTADFETGEIFSFYSSGGRIHDFKLLKEIEATLQPHVLIPADAGCSWNCKKSQKQRNSFQEKKNCHLSEEEKAEKRKLSKKADKI